MTNSDDVMSAVPLIVGLLVYVSATAAVYFETGAAPGHLSAPVWFAIIGLVVGLGIERRYVNDGTTS